MYPENASRSFSYLCTGNVAGALAATALPLFLIELLGFRRTLKAGAACNVVIAILALAVARVKQRNRVVERARAATEPGVAKTGKGSLLGLLFATGLATMGLERGVVPQCTP